MVWHWQVAWHGQIRIGRSLPWLEHLLNQFMMKPMGKLVFWAYCLQKGHLDL